MAITRYARNRECSVQSAQYYDLGYGDFLSENSQYGIKVDFR